MNRNLFSSQAGTTAVATIDNTLGRKVLDRAEIGPDLPARMALDDHHIPFPPYQIGTVPTNAKNSTWTQLAQTLVTMQSRGGYEAIVEANRKSSLARAENALADSFTGVKSSSGYAEIVRQVRDEVEKLKAGYTIKLAEYTKAAWDAENTLTTYRKANPDAAPHKPGILDGLRQIFSDFVPTPKAITAFNEIEKASLHAACHKAAIQVVTQIETTCDHLLGALDTTRSAAEAGAADALRNAAQLEQDALQRGRTADIMVNTTTLSKAGSTTTSLDMFLPRLIAEARDRGGDNLPQVAQKIATEQVAREFDQLDIIAFMKMEAAADPAVTALVDPERVPLMTATRALDIARRSRPGPRLTQDARPRELVLQVSSSPRPLFGHDGLIAAQYHKTRAEFAFVVIQDKVALDELQVMRNGAKNFAEKLALREFFIFEEIALAWRNGAIATTDPAQTSIDKMDKLTTPLVTMPSANGHRE